jgi:hypothetical protein
VPAKNQPANNKGTAKPNRNISRIDFKNKKGEIASGGWEVRFHRRGKKVAKFFADKKAGGRVKALTLAKQFRDQVEQTLTKYSVHDLSKNPSKRNQSGVVGVRRHEQTDIRGEWGYTYTFWIAQWTDENGKRKTKSFSANHYGEPEAFNMAVKARKKGMTERKKKMKEKKNR